MNAINLFKEDSGASRNRRVGDRRTSPAAIPAPPTGAAASMLMRVLDEVDHGLVLLDAHGRATYANQLALHELEGDGALLLTDCRVFARSATDNAALQAALGDAQRGRRRLFRASGAGGQAISLAVVPMAPPTHDPSASACSVLLVFGKRHAVESLTADFFARSHGLTPAETIVLKALCTGRKPHDIALDQGVKVSTIRTQISSIRAKTEAVSIRDLLHRVAVLPPMTPALKSSSGAASRMDGAALLRQGRGAWGVTAAAA